MKRTRPIIWAALALITAALLAVFYAPQQGDKSKTTDLQAYAVDSLAKLQVLDKPRAPLLTLKTADGQLETLDAYQGKVVLLNLWATWCAPCVAEMPSLDRLEAAMGGDDFTVIALSLDRQGLDKVQPFFKRLSLTHLDIYLDEKAASMRVLKASNLPISLLINRKGEILARLDGPAEWDSAAAQALIQAALEH